MATKNSLRQENGRLAVHTETTGNEGKKETLVPDKSCHIHIWNHEFEQILNDIPQAIRIINKDFTIRRINKAFAEMTGVNQKDIVGKQCWKIFPSSHCHTPNCRLQRILDGEKTIQERLERKKKDGSNIPCVVSVTPLSGDSGELTGIIEQFCDITERLQLQEQIKESEEHYRALIDLGTKIGESIAMLQDTDGIEGKFIFASDRWSEAIGYSKEELLRMSFFQLIVPAEKKEFLNRYRLERAGAATAGLFELTIMHNNGVEIPVEITSAVTNFQGKQATVIYMRDITERKQAEEQLRQSENRYHSLFDHAPVAIWEMDYSECKKYIDALKAKGIKNIEGYFDKNPDELIQVFRLVRTIDVNNANITMNGASSKDELIDNVNRTLSQTPGALKDFATNTLALANGINKLIFEETGTFPGGERHYHIVHISVAPGCEQTLSRVFFSMIDITDRKIAEEELKKYKDRLEEMVEERTEQLKAEIEQRKQIEAKLHMLYDTERRLNTEINRQMQDRVEFSRVLVHELKTPLTPILSSSDYMVAHITDEPLKSFARQINNGALNLSNRIDELLDIAKGEVGLLKLTCGKLNLRNLLQECRSSFETVARERKIKLELIVSSEIPCIYADSGRIRQVIFNLMDNAMKNTQQGGKIILKGLQQANKVVIEVHDTGCGIAEKDCKYLFQPYRRLHVQKEKRLGGLGLGLSICKMLIELHGEKIWFDTRVGYGSTFYFTLPVYSASRSARRKKE